MTRRQAFQLLEAARTEMESVRAALLFAVRDFDAPAFAKAISPLAPTLHELRSAADNLELTYTLRVFATFESILRDFWTGSMQGNPRTKLNAVMNRVAARSRMDDETLNRAHAVRDFRNDIMHQNADDLRLGLLETLSALGHFISYLPVNW